MSDYNNYPKPDQGPYYVWIAFIIFMVVMYVLRSYMLFS